MKSRWKVDKIETLSDLAPYAYGALALAIFRYVGKFLEWCGRKIAEGANKDLIRKLMPSVAEYFEENMKKFKDEIIFPIVDELNHLKNSVEKYKSVKHDIETENKYLKQAIKDGDQELLKIIQDYLNEKK